MNTKEISGLAWQKGGGLLPVIVQHASNHQVLMLGYMNQEALAQTLATKVVTFYSRSKQRLWVKGETSGHTLKLIDIIADCDQDALLAMVEPTGFTCHTGSMSCFKEAPLFPFAFLNKLEKVIQDRKTSQSKESYTAKLFSMGIQRMAQKVGEEGLEVALAAVSQDETALCNESADLLFHLLVLLQAKGLNFSNVITVLAERG